jgi:predicted dehydrogenase
MEIGVIGAGWWGKNVINTFEQVDAVTKVHIFDVDPSAYEKFKENKKAVRASSLDDITGNPAITGVCVITPPQTHYEIAKSMLEAGKHVLVEKPPAPTVEHIRELGTYASRNGLVYMLDSIFLFMQPIAILRDLLTSGRIGKLKMVQAYRIGDELRIVGKGLPRIRSAMFNNGIDVVYDLFYHDASILTTLLGDIELVSARKVYCYHPGICDSAHLVLRKDDVTIESTVSWAYTGRRRGITLYTDTHIVEYDAFAAEPAVTIFDLEAQTCEKIEYQQVQPLTPTLEYYIECIKEGKPPFCGYELMMRVTQLMEDIKNVG